MVRTVPGLTNKIDVLKRELDNDFGLWDHVVKGVIDMSSDERASEREREFIKGIRGLLVSSLVREEITARETRDVGSGRRGAKIGAKDLMTEVERVLSRASGGLSLLDRL